MIQAVVSFRAHSGWAVLVTLSAPVTKPAVVQRRRIELAGSETPGSVQPFHTATQMNIGEAEAFIAECAVAAAAKAERALRKAIADLDNAIVGCGILWGAGRPTPDLARTLASHAMIHTAEGHFFRQALIAACHACRLPVKQVAEKTIGAEAIARFSCSPAELERRLVDLGRSVGPPWRQDEKLCALASWMLLAEGSWQPGDGV